MRLVAAALVALTLFAGPVHAQPTIELAPGEALLSVEAEGVARTRPDLITIGAGTVTTGATAAEAVAANAALAQRLIEAVRAAGVEARDVRTSNFRVEPRFEGGRDRNDVASDGRPPRIVGYVVENSVAITLRDLGNASAIISSLFEAGANSVRGPQFSLADDGPSRRAAERDAIAEARVEAENYATAIGRRIARVIRISDRRTWVADDGESNIIVTGSRIPRTPIEPGEIETRSVVHVDFALAPQ